MHDLLQAAETVTSSLIYSEIGRALLGWIRIDNGILLVPLPEQRSTLTLVDVIGELPGQMNFEKLGECLEKLPSLASNIHVDFPALEAYTNLVHFKSNDNRSHAFFLYNGETPAPTLELKAFIERTAHLLQIKNAFDSVPGMEKALAKLGYQLNFFANAINNIFEPYPIYMLAQLYMEIVSEMFLLPAALTLEYQDGILTPLYAKGTSIELYSAIRIDTAPFIKNRDLSMFPSITASLNPDHIGHDNHQQLVYHRVRLLMPLNSGQRLRYLIAGISVDPIEFDYQDQLNLLALGNTLNHALRFADVQESLNEQTRTLDRKVFSLSALYQAAESILSAIDISDTMSRALDMIMEIFQSAISAVVIRSRVDERFELLRIKSVTGQQPFKYWLDRPVECPLPSQVLVEYASNPEARREFLACFPDFEHLESALQPMLLVHLHRNGKYYGFISLSNRVTGESYDKDALELLKLLVNSISLAIDNAFMYAELQEANQDLQASLNEIYAIQDIIGIIRKSSNLEDMADLLVSSIQMGLKARDIVVLKRQGRQLSVLSGKWRVSSKSRESVLACKRPEMIEYSRAGKMVKALVMPFRYTDVVDGYLLVHEFEDTVLDNDDRFRLLSVICAISAESFHNLSGREAFAGGGVMNFHQYMVNTIQHEVELLEFINMPVILVRIQCSDPFSFIKSSDSWATGFILGPDSAILVASLDDDELDEKLQELNGQHRIFSAAEIEQSLAPLALPAPF